MTAQELIDALAALPADRKALPVLVEIEADGQYGTNAVSGVGEGDFVGSPYVGLHGTEDVLGEHGLRARD